MHIQITLIEKIMYTYFFLTNIKITNKIITRLNKKCSYQYQ
jgi:hypothetical protein